MDLLLFKINITYFDLLSKYKRKYHTLTKQNIVKVIVDTKYQLSRKIEEYKEGHLESGHFKVSINPGPPVRPYLHKPFVFWMTNTHFLSPPVVFRACSGSKFSLVDYLAHQAQRSGTLSTLTMHLSQVLKPRLLN